MSLRHWSLLLSAHNNCVRTTCFLPDLVLVMAMAVPLQLPYTCLIPSCWECSCFPCGTCQNHPPQGQTPLAPPGPPLLPSCCCILPFVWLQLLPSPAVSAHNVYAASGAHTTLWHCSMMGCSRRRPMQWQPYWLLPLASAVKTCMPPASTPQVHPSPLLHCFILTDPTLHASISWLSR